MRGFMENGAAKNTTAAVEFYTRIIEVLEWGRERWKNASRDERGAIFEDTNLIGFRCMRIQAYMNVGSQDRNS